MLSSRRATASRSQPPLWQSRQPKVGDCGGRKQDRLPISAVASHLTLYLWPRSARRVISCSSFRSITPGPHHGPSQAAGSQGRSSGSSISSSGRPSSGVRQELAEGEQHGEGRCMRPGPVLWPCLSRQGKGRGQVQRLTHSIAALCRWRGSSAWRTCPTARSCTRWGHAGGTCGSAATGGKRGTACNALWQPQARACPPLHHHAPPGCFRPAAHAWPKHHCRSLRLLVPCSVWSRCPNVHCPATECGSYC